MATDQQVYDFLLPLIAELIRKDVLDRKDLAKTYEKFAAVFEQQDKDSGLLLALATQIRQSID